MRIIWGLPPLLPLGILCILHLFPVGFISTILTGKDPTKYRNFGKTHVWMVFILAIKLEKNFDQWLRSFILVYGIIFFLHEGHQDCVGATLLFYWFFRWWVIAEWYYLRFFLYVDLIHWKGAKFLEVKKSLEKIIWIRGVA